jgi:hypothetical protein
MLLSERTAVTGIILDTVQICALRLLPLGDLMIGIRNHDLALVLGFYDYGLG